MSADNMASSLYLPIVILSLSVSLTSGFEEWSISGNCPQEPQPVLNAFRTVYSSYIEYDCSSTNTLTYASCSNGQDYGTLPECEFSCGQQPQWSGVSVTNMPGTSLGDVISFWCLSLGMATTWTGECTYEGWDVVYPTCILTQVLSEWRDRTFSDGSVLNWNDCSSSPVYGTQPWVTTSITWSHSMLYDVKVVAIQFSSHIDSSWTMNFDIIFIRQGTEVDRVNIQRPNDNAHYVYISTPSIHFAVSEVRIQAVEASFIGLCNIEVYGQLNDGSCGTILVPFNIDADQQSTTTYLECTNGFHYIGGDKEMACAYNLTWVYNGPIGIQCTDRPNLAGPMTSSVISYGVSIREDKLTSGHHHHYQTPNVLKIDVGLAEGEAAMIERVVIDIQSSYYTVETVNVRYDNGQTSILTPCQQDEDYKYGNSLVFFCHKHPLGHRVEITVESYYQNPLGHISYIFILGTPLDTDEVLECYESDNGEDYRGTVAIAVNGQACIQWSVADSSLKGDDFPDLGMTDAANYCRNPRGEQSRPFCYTAQGTFICPVTKCSHICSRTTNGWDYKGDISHDLEGTQCRNWADGDVPYIRGWDFPDGSRDAAVNYCRNPGKLQTRPWCYVDGQTQDGQTQPVASWCLVPHKCPTSENSFLEIAKWDDAKANLQHQTIEWYKCYHFSWNSSEPLVLTNQAKSITTLEKAYHDDGFVWMSCVSMRSAYLEWSTFYVASGHSTSTQIAPIKLSSVSSVVLDKITTDSSALIPLSSQQPPSSTLDPIQASTNVQITTINQQVYSTESESLISSSMDNTPAAIQSVSPSGDDQTTTLAASSEMINSLSTLQLHTAFVHQILSISTQSTAADSSLGSSEQILSSQDPPGQSSGESVTTSWYTAQSSPIAETPMATADHNSASQIAPSEAASSETNASESMPSETIALETTPYGTIAFETTPLDTIVSGITPLVTTKDLSSSAENSLLSSELMTEISTLTLSIITFDPMSSSTIGSSSSSINVMVSPALSTSSTASLMSLTNGTLTSSQCPCSCSTIDAITITQIELETINEAIKEELYVDKSKLSSTIRRKTSAQDDRPEAVTSGMLSVVFMTSALTALVIFDAIQVFDRFRNVLRRFGFMKRL